MADSDSSLQTKTCTKCGEIKPIKAFQRGRSACKACCLLYRRNLRAHCRAQVLWLLMLLLPPTRIPDHHKLCTKCQGIKPIEEFRGIHDSRYTSGHRKAECLSCELQRGKAYRETNAEKCAQRCRNWYEANKFLSNAQSRAWHKAHPEYGRLHYHAHVETYAMYAKRRRARKAGALSNTLTAAQWRMIQTIQKHRCYYCEKLCKGTLTQDHLTPLSQGGLHILQNIIGACKSCNSKKYTGPPLKPVQPLLL